MSAPTDVRRTRTTPEPPVAPDQDGAAVPAPGIPGRRPGRRAAVGTAPSAAPTSPVAAPAARALPTAALPAPVADAPAPATAAQTVPGAVVLPGRPDRGRPDRRRPAREASEVPARRGPAVPAPTVGPTAR
jgi:hypothetical protein